ncbi:winged helix-turn-helix transcriptional regulator [Natrinema longum]|uniref:winged helix-turn-helix transcriptional regulator n=1 Tax=Natrinema longum TaxID=370324 RepID=UPI001CCA312B|nr:helix-turn-helix domain-containing protein [Natrinema longum]
MSAFAFAEEPLRFSDLEERLEVPANTLSERLKELVAVGFLRRESSTSPPRSVVGCFRRLATSTRGPSSTTSKEPRSSGVGDRPVRLFDPNSSNVEVGT